MINLQSSITFAFYNLQSTMNRTVEQRNREQGTGNKEQGTRNREQGIRIRIRIRIRMGIKAERIRQKA